MKECPHCKVTVRGQNRLCPLCQNELTIREEPISEVFPYIPTLYQKYHRLIRSLISISILICIISLYINYLVTPHIWWSLFVLLGFISAWASIFTALKQRNNITRTIYYQVIIFSALIIAWDFLTGWHRFSISYVLPILYISAMVSMLIIRSVLHLRPEDSLIYLWIHGLLGIVPAIFLLFNLVSSNILSLVCIGVSICSLLILLLFEGKNMVAELKKRLHF